MDNVAIAVLSILIGGYIASLRFRYERAWQIKHEFYSDLLKALDEIRLYANDGATMNIPAGGALTDLTETEIHGLIGRNVAWLGRSISTSSIFISPQAVDAIRNYVSAAKGHHFNLANAFPSEYEDQEEAFDHAAFCKHAELAEEAADEIAALARNDLHGRPWLRGLGRLRNNDHSQDTAAQK
ncbi:hypothetical protein [Halomonas ventosae]|uniref:hypothetical protein n=1 Tax=Halomonas ventosae TaxID=229007 RepID=UPI0010607BB7|nr:hypothetical protein [Halomonas ventosae]